MNELYLTKTNIEKKGKEWLKTLNFSKTRKSLFPYNKKKSALLIIDMQKFFTEKKSHAFIPSSDAIIPKINLLIDTYRNDHNLIIFTYHAYEKQETVGIMKKWWKDVVYTDNPISKISSTIHYELDDIIIRKNRYSAFINTDLDQKLKEHEIKQIIVTGVMTHLCCESTAREAFMKDYQVFFAIDATATDTEEHHLSSLKTLSDGFAIPITATEITS